MLLARLFIATVSICLIVWSIYLLAMPLLSFRQKPDKSSQAAPTRSQRPHISVVIPAHDMEDCIERCIKLLLGSRYPGDRVEVCIVADHCSDQTAAVACAAGAEVLIRDEEPAGKTFTLDRAFRQLKSRGVTLELYVIVDATAYVADDFRSCLAERWSYGGNIVMAHTLVDPSNQKWFARCLGLTLAHRNLQDAARERLSLSVLVGARSIAFEKEYFEKLGWCLAFPPESIAGPHLTEDFRHGVRLAEHGYRVAFAAVAQVHTPLPQSLGAPTRQSFHWERGCIGNAYTHARDLLFQAVREKPLRKLIVAVDAIQLPVAVVLGPIGVLALLAVLSTDTPSMLLIASLPFALVSMYSMLVIGQGRREGIELTALLRAQVYIAWCVSTFLAALSGLDRLQDKKNRRTSLP